MGLRDLVRAIEQWELLDPVSGWIAGKVAVVNANDTARDVLSGRWLGHPLHPTATDLPIGLWSAAVLLDIAGGKAAQPAARTLVGAGVITALPTVASGLSDWADTLDGERRVGTVHAAANGVGLVLFTASYAARRAGGHGDGRRLALAGTLAVAAGGYLGGHLVFGRGMGVDRTAWTEGPRDWTDVGAESQLGDGSPVAMPAGDDTVLVVRRHGVVHAISDRCSHMGGPLHEGVLTDDMCVVCPWHQSSFRLEDGAVERGPATAPQPAYDSRVREGRVEVRRRPSGGDHHA